MEIKLTLIFEASFVLEGEKWIKVNWVSSSNTLHTA